MAFLKCKMCGGDLEVQTGMSIVECEYCGTKQTLPNLDDDKKANMYDRANHFRRNNEFDKAMSIYEQILNADKTDAESYWSLVLCRYGIEYVEDPSSHKRVPTVNRAQYTSVFADEDYKSALQYADAAQKAIYEAEAKAIDEIQKGILEISQKEDPFDVFICYKDTDNNGRRTMDSVLANDLYHQLTTEGFKVFYSRITLEDKLGTAYEPYIFAALNSAKVMVVLGTKPEYFNAVWVKNEWSRYLALIKNGAKKMLIPAYKDMDPYDLPEEFSHLQAQDMSKLGFMQDLIRGISKIIDTDKEKTASVTETVVMQNITSGNIDALLKRGKIALEDSEWNRADAFFEDVLNQDAECAEAYIGKALAANQCVDLNDLVEKKISAYKTNAVSEKISFGVEEDHITEMMKQYEIPGYLSAEDICNKYAYRFTYESYTKYMREVAEQAPTEWNNDKLLSRATKYANGTVTERLEEAKREFFDKIVQEVHSAEEMEQYLLHIQKERCIEKVAESDRLLKEDYNKAIQKKDSDLEEKERKYQDICQKAENATSSDELKQCIEGLHSFEVYKDSLELIDKYQEKLQKLLETEKEKIAAVKLKKQAEQSAKKRKILFIVSLIVILGVIATGIYVMILKPAQEYEAAMVLLEEGEYEKAYMAFEAIGDYKDSEVRYVTTKAIWAMEKKEACDYESYTEFKDIIVQKNYQEILSSKVEECVQREAYDEALIYLKFIDNYKDSKEQIAKITKILLEKAEVGDVVVMGSLEQDAIATNGKEPIEWIVLDRQGDRILLFSKYILAYDQFHWPDKNVTWENCLLRANLNGELFYNKAFTDEEKENILLTVTEEPNVLDKIFLLSQEEMEQYVRERSTLRTEYVSNQAKDDYRLDYALRSINKSNDAIYTVNNTHGKISDLSAGSLHRASNYYNVRPAMWISINE